MGKLNVLENSCSEDNRIKRAGMVQDLEKEMAAMTFAGPGCHFPLTPSR